MIRMLYLVNSD